MDIGKNYVYECILPRQGPWTVPIEHCLEYTVFILLMSAFSI